MSTKQTMTAEDKSLVRKLFWRSFPLEGSFNFEKMQALGFAFAMFPAIKRFCKTKEEQAAALKRHTQIFNTTPHISTFLIGLAASMEKKYAENPDKMDPSTINAVKVSLMGPLAGIGDSFFWGTFRVIATGVGISLAQQGSILGPIIFLLMFNIPHLIIRYLCTVWGYTLGDKFLQSTYESGLIGNLSKIATVIGLTTVGAMISSMVSMQVSFTTTIGQMDFVLQDILDQVMPGLLPLTLTLVVFALIRKGVKINYIILGVFALGLIGTLVGIF
ncbi:MAG: PTS system mannose/fructose/sorbose family transporter subunit IID [Faecalibacterium sp.]|jgi:mannose/fructose/sorbose-specific phosphotransferase system IID component|nr:PTS system mannose/fructose/sorbose family transporter subunit IID [Faecalibacterium sp.]